MKTIIVAIAIMLSNVCWADETNLNLIDLSNEPHFTKECQTAYEEFLEAQNYGAFDFQCNGGDGNAISSWTMSIEDEKRMEQEKRFQEHLDNIKEIVTSTIHDGNLTTLSSFVDSDNVTEAMTIVDSNGEQIITDNTMWIDCISWATTNYGRYGNVWSMYNVDDVTWAIETLLGGKETTEDVRKIEKILKALKD